MTNNQHGQVPEALTLAALFDADEWPGNVTLVSYARECVAELRRLHALTAQAISQPGGFDAGDMASAAAGGGSPVSDDGRGLKPPCCAASQACRLVRPSVMTGAD